jgi:hypothetical protein
MLIIASKPGQLGNILFVYSHVIARAIESNLSVADPALDDYADLFPSTRNDLLCRFPAQRSLMRPTARRRRLVYRLFHTMARILGKLKLDLPPVRQITLSDWHSEFNLGEPAFLASLRPQQWVLLRGWLFRDDEAMSKHSHAVRDFLRPHDRNQRNIDELIARARAESDVLIGIHVRHGIIHFANTRKYFYTAHRYAEMMDELVTLFPGKRVSFLICSDWPQDPGIFFRFKVTFGTGDLIEDMYAFARCDYLIGPPSTFTMWSSFYGEVPLNLICSNDQRQILEDFRVQT